jgi:hypothetical protein
MKNIHVLPTEKLRKGYIVGKCIKELSDVKIGQFVKTHYLIFSKEYFQPHNIYITSDEIPKFLDHYIVKIKDSSREGGVLGQRLDKNDSDYSKCKKIILTTDQDLIKDGVQAIDNQFLEWFVKNPSCVEVEVESNKCLVKRGGCDCSELDIDCQCLGYKIIIPKEEPKQYTSEKLEGFEDFKKIVKPKQETLEEACAKYVEDSSHELYELRKQSFIDGAKWQLEQNNTSNVTRIEVIQHSEPYNGRAYTNYNAKNVELQYQDKGKNVIRIF